MLDNLLNVGRQQIMLTSLINTSKRLLHGKTSYTVCRLQFKSYLVETNWRVSKRTKPGSQSTEGLWAGDQIGMIKLYINLSLFHGLRESRPQLCRLLPYLVSLN